MKVQSGSMLLQDMCLRVGEKFRLGKKGAVMVYLGATRRNGKTWDKIAGIDSPAARKFAQQKAS
jgi:hypothetical protein